MMRLNSTLFWLIVDIIIALSFFFLRTILLPFVIVIAVAYFLDPVVDKLEERKWNRSLATLVSKKLSIQTCLNGVFDLKTSE